VHGPLSQVPRSTYSLPRTISGSVSAYGADYYVFNVGSASNITINVNTSSSNFGYLVIELDGNYWDSYQYTGGGREDYTYSKSTAGRTAFVLIITGNPNGGSYTVTANSSAATVSPSLSTDDVDYAK
jgi:hypothetical protein